VARHRRDDQEPRTLVDAVARKMLELAERLADQDLLVNPNLLAADLDAVDAELGLPARSGGMGENLEARRHHRAHRAIAERIGGIAQPSGAQTRELARTCEKRTLHFIGVVEHRTSFLPSGRTHVARGVTGCKAHLLRRSKDMGISRQRRTHAV
jgi:hypothetical protein